MHSDIALEILNTTGFLGSPGETLAYKRNAADALHKNAPTLIWCGGLKSDMEGGKATHLQDWAIEQGRAFIRFDYYGHGESSGDFEKAGIGRWAQDTAQVIDDLAEGDVILIGSSMGGWAALLAALERPARIVGLVLIAPAPDFTGSLMWDGFSKDIQNEIMTQGVYYEPSEYGEPMPISKMLIEDGQENLILDKPIPFSGPVRILQGMQDPDVPYKHAMKLIDTITSEDLEITLVKSGDHRLSNPIDLKRLVTTVDGMCQQLCPPTT